VAKSSKLPFYTKFVVEENLAKIDELKERQKYWGRTFLICVFSMLPAVFATFVGFNFSHPFFNNNILFNDFIRNWSYFFLAKTISLRF